MQEYPFLYDKSILFCEEDIPIDCDTEMLKKFFKDRTYGKVEYVLLETLYHFPVLNKYSMKRNMDLRLKDKAWKDYSNLLTKLIGDGVVRRLTYGTTHLYELTENARAYMEEKTKEDVIRPKREVFTLLEHASLAQWHISLLLDKDVRRHTFSKIRKINNMLEPVRSFVELKKGKYTYKVFSLPLPKSELVMESFLELIRHTAQITKGIAGRNTITLIVVCASTLKEIENAAAILKEWEGTSGKKIYFVLDANTKESVGLEKLYYLEEEDGKSVLNTLKVKEYA